MRAALCAILLTAFSVFGGSLRVVQSVEEIPERGPVPRLLLQTSAGVFSFIPPAGCGNTLDQAQEKITFQFDREGAVLSVRFSTNAPPKTTDQINGFVEDHWPNARITERAAAYTRDGEGKLIECVFASAANTVYRARVAFVPSANGHVEFVLAAPENWPTRLHSTWTALLNSFQAEQSSAKRLFQARR